MATRSRPTRGSAHVSGLRRRRGRPASCAVGGRVMFVALKNWRERLRHRGGASGDRLVVGTELALWQEEAGSDGVLRLFRAVALSPPLAPGDPNALGELGAQFAGAAPLTDAENLSIMASVERGA